MTTIARAGRAAALALALGLATPAVAPAQDEFAPVEEAGSGEPNPIGGYLACGVAVIAILFLICTSSRR